MALAPLQWAFGLEQINVVTMQALSGAGYPGVASMDVIDNVLPYIEGEEEKVETEPLKILGKYKSGKVIWADFKISAQCHRVNVQDGHLEAVSVSFRQRPSWRQLVEALSSFRSLPQELNLPSAPRRPVVCLEDPDRPQPRLDRHLEKGMATVVGRIRPCSIFDYKFDLLGHNTIRGAAGAALLNAELLWAQGVAGVPADGLEPSTWAHDHPWGHQDRHQNDSYHQTTRLNKREEALCPYPCVFPFN